MMLLKKIEQERQEQLQDNQKFESELREILKRHDVNN